MRYFNFLFIAVWGFSLVQFGRPLLAEENPETVPMTWEACLKEALQNYPGIKAAQAAHAVADYQYQSSRGPFFPEIAAFVDYKRNSETSQKDGSLSSNKRSDAYAAGVKLSQSLFAGFKDQGKLAQGRGKLEMEAVNTRAAYAKLVFELRLAFVNILFNQQSLKLNQETLKHRMDNVQMVRLRYNAGNENKGSLLLAQASQKQADYELKNSQRTLKENLYQLFKLMGRDAQALAINRVEIRGDFDQVQDLGSVPSLDDLGSKTVEHQLAQSEQKLALAEIKLAKSAFYPTLSLNSSLEKQGAELFPNDKNVWTVGVDLSWSLFSGKSDTYALQAARSGLMKAEYQLENVLRDEREKLRIAYDGLENAREKLKVDQDFLEAANVRVEISRKKYVNGLLSFEDWNRIENELVEREMSLLSSKKEVLISRAQWEQVQGKGWEENDTITGK